MTTSRKELIIATVLFLAETGIAVYITVVVWLLSAWMVDDSVAFRMTPTDWYIEAGKRLLVGVLLGGMFGTLAGLVNRRWVVRAFPKSVVVPHLAAVLGFCIGLGALFGSIEFAVTKPFM
jgi:hypothetical protein